MINLLYAGNDKMFKAWIMSLLSIASKTNEELNVVLLTGDYTKIDERFQPMGEVQKEFVEKILKHYNSANRIRLCDLTCETRELVSGKNANTGYTPYTLLRLYLTKESIASFPDRLLYLDMDIMANGDVNELYCADLEGNTLGMVKDYVGKWWVGENYCNAGVILFDTDRLLANYHKFEKAREKILTTRMTMPDQTAINKAFEGDICKLPRKFNEQHKMQSDTILRHYCNVLKFFPIMHIVKVKPWDDINKFHKLRKEYDFDALIRSADELVEQFKRGEEPTF